MGLHITAPNWACLPLPIGTPVMEAPVFCRESLTGKWLNKGTGGWFKSVLPSSDEYRINTGGLYLSSRVLGKLSRGLVKLTELGQDFLLCLCSMLACYYRHCMLKRNLLRGGDFSRAMKKR